MIELILDKIYSYVLRRILNDEATLEKINLRLDQIKIRKNISQVTLGIGSRFYPESEVFNIRNNSEYIRIGENSHIRGELLLFGHGGEIEIGNNVYLGKGSRIWSADKVVIGNNVLISHNVNIIDTDSHEIDHIKRADTFVKMTKEGHASVNQNIQSKSIIIEDFAWLSYNVSILKGVRIGKGAVVAAGSIVTKDVEAFTLVKGNPAKFAKNINCHH